GRGAGVRLVVSVTVEVPPMLENRCPIRCLRGGCEGDGLSDGGRARREGEARDRRGLRANRLAEDAGRADREREDGEDGPTPVARKAQVAGHRTGREEPGLTHRSTRAGGLPRRIRKRVYLPITSALVTKTSILTPGRR